MQKIAICMQKIAICKGWWLAKLGKNVISSKKRKGLLSWASKPLEAKGQELQKTNFMFAYFPSTAKNTIQPEISNANIRPCNPPP